MNVEGAAEDIGEPNDVIDLVGIVGTSRRHQHVGACLHSVFVGNFGDGVGQGKDDGVFGHALDHLFRQDVTLGQSDKDVGAVDGLFQRVDVGTLGGKETLLLVQVLTAGSNDTLGVEHDDILFAGTDSHIELGARDSCRTGTIDDNAHLGDVFADDFQGVFQTGSRDDGRAVLVVVHDGDVECALQALFNIETFGSLDVFQVDTAKGRGNTLDGFAELFGVFLVDLDIKDVDTAIDLKEQTLTLHDGLAAHSANVAQSQYGGTVRNNSDQVSLVGISIGVVGILLDFQTRIGHTGGVSQRKVCLCTIGLGGLYFDFSGASCFVVLQGGFF